MALFDSMEAAGVARDRVTYNAVVRACEKCGEYNKAFELRMEASEKFGPDEEEDGAAAA